MKTKLTFERRNFLRGALGTAATICAAPLNSAQREAEPRDWSSGTWMPYEFETVAPSLLITELDDSRLLTVVSSANPSGSNPTSSGLISLDAGKTWGKPFQFLQGGKPLSGFCESVLRLKNGTLGMTYYTTKPIRARSYSTSCCQYYFSLSHDEGKTWGAGHELDVPGVYDPERGVTQQSSAGGAMIQLSGGRLLNPMYWYMGGRYEDWLPSSRAEEAFFMIGDKRESSDGHCFEALVGGSYAYYSDDPVQSWERSFGSILVWPLPSEDYMGGFGATFEPKVIELKDGRVTMFLRTQVGRLFQSFSHERGTHWSLAKPTTLGTGDSPCRVGRLRTTGDLLILWNQASAEEIRRGYYRGRLSAALSSDETRTWEHFHTVECSAGLDPRPQVAPPPIRHIHPVGNLGDIPEGYALYHYPNLAFVQEKIIMVYKVFTYPRGKFTTSIKLRAVPEKALYA